MPAQDLAGELGRFLAGEPIRARRPGIVEQGTRWLAKQKRSVALAIGVAAATAALLVGTIAGTAIYRKSLDGKLGLDSEHTRLVAEIRGAGDAAILPAFTIPTQQPVVLPAGDYTVRASGKELLSEDFSVRIERGQTQQFKLSLEGQRLWPTNDIAGAFHVVPYVAGKSAALLDLHEKGVRFSAPSLKQDLWTRTFDPLDDAKLKAIPAFQWKWSHWDTMTSGYGQYDFCPQVLEPCPRLDEDQLGDIVLACRHQPVVIALSTNKGETLWAYAPPEMAEVAKALETRITSGPALRTGTIVGEPLMVPDLDGDTVVDLIVASVLVTGDRSQDLPQPRRLIDAVSGKTGQRIWSYSLDEKWFELLNVPAAPHVATWYARHRGSGGGGSTHHPYGNTFRDYQKHTIAGEGVVLPYPLETLRFQGQDVVSCVAGTRIVLLDPKTGKDAAPRRALEFFPQAVPRIVKYERDQGDSLLLTQYIGGMNSAGGFEAHALWLGAPAADKPHWVHSAFHGNYEKDCRQHQPRPQWPLVADLDGDGRDEVITAADTSLYRPFGVFHAPSSRAWGEIWLLGKTQEDLPVWKRRLETVDQQVDQFVAGPDINGDGWRDLFAANIFSRGYNSAFVYVDAISGKTGEILWSSGQPIDMQGHNQIENEIVGQLRWWGPSRLVVPVIDGENGQGRGLFILAAADGRLLHQSPDLVPAQIVDGDGDRLDDLFCYAPTNPSQPDKGGHLLSFRGTAEPAWRQLGVSWQAGGDYDGDGSEDVITSAVEYVYGGQIVAARSGRTGNLLYSTAPTSPIWAGSRIVPLSADLDGDGTGDFLAVDGHRGSDGETPPLHAFSGKSGREIWQPAWGAGSTGATLLIEAVDLEADGRPEVMFVAEMSFAGPDGAAPSFTDTPLWLVVLEGRTGKLRWKQMLNDRVSPFGGIERVPIASAYADLNGDKIADVIVPAVIVKNQYPELRAYHGQTGELLWNPVPLPGYGGQDGQFVVDYLPRPTAADIDGDGQPEILVQDAFLPAELVTRDVTHSGRSSPVGGYTGAAAHFSSRVMALDGRTGKEKWKLDLPTGSESPQTHDGGGITAYRSRPLIVRRGTAEKPAICVWLFAGDWQKPEATLILLDGEGQELWRLPAGAANRQSLFPRLEPRPDRGRVRRACVCRCQLGAGLRRENSPADLEKVAPLLGDDDSLHRAGGGQNARSGGGCPRWASAGPGWPDRRAPLDLRRPAGRACADRAAEAGAAARSRGPASGPAFCSQVQIAKPLVMWQLRQRNRP